ncbi:glycosyltransferase family 2 protein [Patescibacteria group bacterium]|nr:MAG: glycosyltransferase family 2 protein [Patescibacteria group bacterium]
MNNHPYLHVGRATELSGLNRAVYRFLEILPGALSFGTLIGFVALSIWNPAIAAYITILFSSYWLFKTIFLSVHLRYNYIRLRRSMETDWLLRLEHMKYDDLVHFVVFPFYNEPYEVIAESIKAVQASRFPLKQIAIVLAAEEERGDEARLLAEKAKAEFGGDFLDFLVTVHPYGVEGEIPGKGSNISYAAKSAKKDIADRLGIPLEKVIVSAFDIDTVVYPDYFACLTWHFLTAERPLRSSFQPIPLYNNNIWDAPMLSRVLAYSSTFWQMILQERPERLATFSSHAVSLATLEEAGYWQPNVVSEDSRIYWNLFMFYDGDYTVVPITYPVSMDANAAPSFFGTVKNLYKQHRRWGYGAENIAYIVFNFWKNSKISLSKKIGTLWVQVEGFWSLATHPLILFAFGWLPLFIGGHTFNTSVLSYNLPIVARWFLAIAMLGLIVSAVFCTNLVPRRPENRSRSRAVMMFAQWILVPFTMVFFSAIPGLEAQARLMTGRYLGFWVTPKLRRKKTPETKTV